MTLQHIFKLLIYMVLAFLIGLFILSLTYPVLFEQLLKNSNIFLHTSYDFQGWQLLLLGSMAFMAVAQGVWILIRLTPSSLPFHSYNEDEFKTMTWKWSWKAHDIEKLWCYCPTCAEPLTYSCDHLLYQTQFICEKCEKEIAKYDGDTLHHVFTRVHRDIKRVLHKKHDVKL